MQSQTELMEPGTRGIRGARAYLARSAPNSDTRSIMVSSMGDNVGDDKGCDDKVISTAMEAGFGNTGDGKDV